MGKGKGFTFTLFAVLGALTGYATYMARKDEFSEETKDNYDNFLNKAKNVGVDIQRTYTSIGDKKQFTNNTKSLTESAKKLASKAGDLVVSATSDIYKHAKSHVSEVVDNTAQNYSKKSVVKTSTKKTNSKTKTKPKAKTKSKSKK